MQANQISWHQLASAGISWHQSRSARVVFSQFSSRILPGPSWGSVLDDTVRTQADQHPAWPEVKCGVVWLFVWILLTGFVFEVIRGCLARWWWVSWLELFLSDLNFASFPGNWLRDSSFIGRILMQLVVCCFLTRSDLTSCTFYNLHLSFFHFASPGLRFKGFTYIVHLDHLAVSLGSFVIQLRWLGP
jgi:hypothetical protein